MPKIPSVLSRLSTMPVAVEPPTLEKAPSIPQTKTNPKIDLKKIEK